MFLLGQIAARQTPDSVTSLDEAEFRVFSQFSEDGIIQFLIKAIKPQSRRFIEFGVQTYAESNTRFLLSHNAWSGLVIDIQSDYIEQIRRNFPGWKYDLTIREAHITRNNINDIIKAAGFIGEIGLLSIDLDSIDFYVWKAIDVVDPAIVVIEYNRNFPIDRPITIPYEEHFDRTEKHASNRYWGASLSALAHLANAKGYQFVGAESHQRNAFFVKKNLMTGSIPTDVPRPEHQHASAVDTAKVLAGMPVFNVVTESIEIL
jgi:hypothetical protein